MQETFLFHVNKALRCEVLYICLFTIVYSAYANQPTLHRQGEVTAEFNQGVNARLCVLVQYIYFYKENRFLY